MRLFQRYTQVKRLGLFLMLLSLVWLVTWTSNLICQHEDVYDPDAARLSKMQADRHSKGLTHVAPYLESTEGEQVTRESREFFRGSLMWGKLRQERVFLTIGIPCIARPRNDRYVLKTLHSLIKHSSEEEKKDMVIALFLADFNETARNNTGHMIFSKYEQYVESGLIQMFKAPKRFYPPLENLKTTYGDTVTKIKWRSKQNFDYAYNMLYSQNLSSYYLQLEDDVITVPNYFRIIKDFIAESDKSHWVCLEFSSLGFIAKLYHSYDVEKLARLLMLFYNEQPNDVTYMFFNNLMFQKDRIIRKPTIFDHKGIHSSLIMKMNSLKDPLFVGDPNESKDEADDPDIDNKSGGKVQPSGKASTNFRKYESYTAESFYRGESSIYWGASKSKGDTFTVVFDTPLHISDIALTTGHKYYPEDILRHGILQLGRTGGGSSTRLTCSDIAKSEQLKEGHVIIENIPKDLLVACVQLVVTEKQKNWIMISDLTINTHKT